MIKNKISEEPKNKRVKTSNVGVYYSNCITKGKADKGNL